MARHQSSKQTTLTTAPRLVIQLIQATWTKQSRAGIGAEERNTVPEMLVLPAIAALPSHPVTVIHTVKYQESYGFTRPEYTHHQVIPSIEKQKVHSVIVHPTPEQLHVAAEWLVLAGAPRRQPIPNLLTIQRNNWGQVIYNLRSGLYDGWTYFKFVVNIGYFDHYSETSFVTKPPYRKQSLLEDLW